MTQMLPDAPVETQLFEPSGSLSRSWTMWFNQVSDLVQQAPFQRVSRVAELQYNIKTSDQVVAVASTTQGAVELQLPQASRSWRGSFNLGRRLLVTDTGGNAAANSITIVAAIPDRIIDASPGLRSVQITQDGGGIELQIIDDATWKVV